jgi:hypothetical protein
MVLFKDAWTMLYLKKTFGRCFQYGCPYENMLDKRENDAVVTSTQFCRYLTITKHNNNSNISSNRSGIERPVKIKTN